MPATPCASRQRRPSVGRPHLVVISLTMALTAACTPSSGPSGVRAGARAATATTYDGVTVTRSLELQVRCPGSSVHDEVWDAAVGQLRPQIGVQGSSEGDGWGVAPGG